MSIGRFTILFWLLSFSHEWCFSQAQVAQVQGYTGVSLFPAAQSGDLMSGYKPGPMIGLGASLTIKKSFIFNPNIEFMASSKEHYSLSLLSIHNNIKYYPFLFSKVRPYVMAIVNISFLSLHQEAFQTEVTPDPTYSVSGPNDIPVSTILYREPDLKMSMAPTFGLGAGIGFDVPVRLRVVPFVQFSIVYYSTKSSSLLNDNFPNNISGLSTQNITAGIRYNLYKSLKK